ncbi:MAG: hypothetical protein GC203_10525 [Phenylobacterium sp.]|uniref:hypothetical protein n=1 Tax=Phenylobacterium sp. TaxID=1871053 RepID=UPI0025F4A3AB|nr:hypothetical protein [Phenylobacterium sp.]MBI1198286.1 hypothetical protein [Phenylobacterium sp.]
MPYASAYPMLVAYREGRTEVALAAAAERLAADPFSVDAHMTCALIHLRAGAIAETIASLKACLQVRSAEWVLERLRRDLVLRGARPLSRDMVLKLGALLRSNLSPLGPALAPERRAARHDYVNVVGSSYVRSFGANTALFPLFIGMGPAMLLLDEALAAVTRRKFAENLKRIDASRNTLLIAGSDPYYYVTYARRDDPAWPRETTAEDIAKMEAVAERHRPILMDAKARLAGQVTLLGLTPTFDDKMNDLCRRLNVRLRALCEEVGVGFLDCWDDLLDPATGRLREDCAAQAYVGDIHFSTEAATLLIARLQQEGLLPPTVTPAPNHDWSHVFEVQVDASERSRIWTEPKVLPRNAFESNKVAAAHLGGLVADLLTAFGAQRADQTYLMVNVRDGFMPVAVPPQIHSGCLAFTDSVRNLEAGRMVLDFYGRSDVRLELDDALSLLDGQTFTQTLVMIHPDSYEDDERRANAVLERLPAGAPVVVGTPRPEQLGGLRLGARTPHIARISNRHIPEKWRNYAMAIYA